MLYIPLCAFNGKLSDWIVDPGETNYMTGAESSFESLKPCDKSLTVRRADGCVSKIVLGRVC